MAVEDDIAELRRSAGARSDAELASLLFIHRSAISQWRKRGSVPDKARRAVERLRLNQEAAKTAREETDQFSPTLRLLARAMAILDAVPPAFDTDTKQGLVALAQHLKKAALHFEEAERAGAMLILKSVRMGDPDEETAFLRRIKSRQFLHQEMLEEQMMPSRWEWVPPIESSDLPQSLPQGREPHGENG